MDWSSTDPNGFIMTRDSEGMGHSAIPWDDPYPFFKGMIPHHLKSVLTVLLAEETGVPGENH
jgi:hypothetical protein